MANLRKKYDSIASGIRKDINTTQGSIGYDPNDVGGVVDSETIRVIEKNADISTETHAKTIADLIYNDIQINAEATKTNELLSQGYFRSIIKEFNILILATTVYDSDTYLTKFAILDGQIRHHEGTLRKESNSVEKLTVAFSSGVTTISDLVTTGDLTVGMLVEGDGIPLGTVIDSITDSTTVELSNATTAVATSVTLTFTAYQIYEVGVNVDEITTTINPYPRYRRDLIEIDTGGNYYLIKGVESGARPPVNTVLDSQYQVESILWQSGNTFRISLKTNIRVFDEFSVSDTITLHNTENKEFDDNFVITNKASSTPWWIDITVPKKFSNSFDQSNKGGHIELNRTGLWSVLVYKPDVAEPTLIVDEIQRIVNQVGLSSSINQIIKAEINSDFENIYGLHTREYLHPVDSLGNLLDWEHGQSPSADPVEGFAYNENDLTNYENTQIPQNYDGINSSSLVNIPFYFDEIQDNIFSLSTVTLDSIKLGIKNEPTLIGDEGISVKITTADTVTVDPIAATNLTPSSTTIDAGYDFTSPVNGYQVVVNDYVLITEGAGQYQIGKITIVGNLFLTISGLTKDINNTSKFHIFKLSTESDISGSNETISATILRNQVVGGYNGRYGTGDEYSKLQIDFSGTPQIDIQKWYFVRVKGENEGITWGNLPYINIEDPTIVGNSKRQGFIELFYQPIAGIYPSDGFLIEDEFGDLATVYNDRAESPHFTPTVYKIVAKALDYSGLVPVAIPTQEDVVHVDIHTGRFMFHPLAHPRRIYVSYNKYDVFDGDAKSSTVKYQEHETETKKNVQDKINEINNKFTKADTKFDYNIETNGIRSNTTNGYKGSYKIDPLDNNKILLQETLLYDNTNVEEIKYSAKVSEHSVKDIISVNENNLLVKQNFIETASMKTAIQIAAMDMLYDLPQNGLNKDEDRQLITSNDIDTVDVFQRKQFDTNLNRQLDFASDSVLKNIDDSATVTGKWNHISISNYNDFFQIFKANMRKGYYEDTTNVDHPMSDVVRRKLKEREVIRSLGEGLAVLPESTTNILSEKYITTQNNEFEGRKHLGEYFVTPYTETVQQKYYYFTKNQHSSPLVDLNYFDSVSHDVVTYDAKVIDNKIITAMADPDDELGSGALANRGRVRALNLVKETGTGNDEIHELTLIDQTNPAFDVNFTGTTAGDDVSLKQIITEFDDTKFGIVHFRNDGTLRIFIELRNLSDGTLVTNSNIELTNTVETQMYSHAAYIGENRIAVAWKKSAVQTALVIYEFYINATGAPYTSVTDEIILTTENVLEDPKISTFSQGKFVAVYSYSGGLDMKKFDRSGILEFYDEAETIDTIQISSSVISNGFNFDITEMQNNNLMIVYSENNGGTIDTFVNTFGEYNKTLGIPTEFIFDTSVANRPTDFSLFTLNEDSNVITYMDSSGNLNYVSIQPDGHFNYKTLADGTTTKTVPKTISATEHGMISVYNEASTDLNFDVIEWRPDFNKYHDINGYNASINQLAASQTITGIASATINPGTLAVVYNSGVDASATGWVKVIDVKEKDNHRNITSWTVFQFYAGSGAGDEIISASAAYVDFNRTGNVKALVIAFITTNLELKLAIIDTATGGVLQNYSGLTYDADSYFDIEIADGVSSVELRHIGNDRLALVYRNDTDSTVIIRGIKLAGLDGTPAFDPTNSSDISSEGANSIALATWNTVDDLVNVEYNTTDSRWKTMAILGIKEAGAPDDGAMNIIDFEDGSSDFADGNPIVVGASESGDFVIFNASSTISGLSGVTKWNDKYLIVTCNDVDTDTGLSIIDITDQTSLAFAMDFTNAAWNSQDSNVSTYTQTFDSQVENSFLISRKQTNKAYLDIVDYTNITVKANINTRAVVEISQNNFDAELYVTQSIANELTYFTAHNTATEKFEAVTVKPLPYSDTSNIERIIEETDVSTTKNVYVSNAIRIHGMSFRGNALPSFDIFRSNMQILESDQVTDEIFTSTIHNSSVSIVTLEKNRFTLVFHPVEKQINNKIYMKRFKIFENRFFEDSELLESNDFDWSSGSYPVKNMYMKVVENNDGNVFVTYKDLSDDIIKSVLVTKENTLFSVAPNVVTINNSGQPTPDEIILALGSLVENKKLILIWDQFNDVYYTNIFNENGEEEKTGSSFSISDYNRKTDRVSVVKIDSFGYCLSSYVNGSDLYYHQHGVDGNAWGILQIVGSNVIETLVPTEVIDNLTTDNEEQALSARQGKILNETIYDWNPQNFIWNANHDNEYTSMAETGDIVGPTIEAWGGDNAFLSSSTRHFGYSNIGTYPWIKHTLSRTNMPTFAESGSIGGASITAKVTTASDGFTSEDFCSIEKYIEGFDYTKLHGQPVTLLFWAKASIVGTYCVTFSDEDHNVIYIKEYTIENANIWEKQRIELTLDTQDARWKYNEDVGLRINWCMGSNSDVQAAADTWHTDLILGGSAWSPISTSNQVQMMDVLNSTLSLARFQLVKGQYNTDIEIPFTLAGGSVFGDVAITKRYHEIIKSSFGAAGYHTGYASAASQDIYVHIPMTQKTDQKKGVSVSGGTPTLVNCTNVGWQNTPGENSVVYKAASVGAGIWSVRLGWLDADLIHVNRRQWGP